MPMEIITQEEFAQRMTELKEDPKFEFDKEVRHIEMDGLMCKVLEQFGYTEGVEIFKNTPKWYA